jgi:P-type Ca2+ transporter type 2C
VFENLDRGAGHIVVEGIAEAGAHEEHAFAERAGGWIGHGLERHGPNELREEPGTSAWVLFFHQFKSPLIYVLLAAAVVAAALGETKDAAVIFGVLIINAVIGFIQEGRAERSMAALKKLSSPKSNVRRGGKATSVPSRELVPGDVLLLAAGDKIAADARIIEAAGLVALEGALTGESTGVSKRRKSWRRTRRWRIARTWFFPAR